MLEKSKVSLEDLKVHFDLRFYQLEVLIQDNGNKLPNDLLDNADFIQLMRICARTAQKWRKNGLVPFYKIGNKIYYRYSEIASLLEAQRKV